MMDAMPQGIYLERIHEGWGQWFSIEQILYHDKNDICEQFIFENSNLGVVHVIDGVVQSTAKDEFIYQEMVAHVPLISHPNPKKVLIIGGGDGGVLREALKHRTVEEIYLVEIDPTSIDFSKKHLSHLCQEAFDNPKAKIVIQDGSLFVKECKEKFDVIIIDSSDPEGPSEVLFSQDFFQDCKKLLTENGILSNMSDVPFFQKSTLQRSYQNLVPNFKDVAFFIAAVPTYAGGFIALAFASDDSSLKDLPQDELQKRASRIDGTLHYYNPRIHQASFALPNFMQQFLKT